MNLTFTAKGRDMKFKWRKHGEHSDDIKIIEDDDLYHVTESVIKYGYVFSLCQFATTACSVHCMISCKLRQSKGLII